jgi:hypothetical protein
LSHPLGAHPIFSIVLGLYANATIAASALGTAAATCIFNSSAATLVPSFTYAQAVEIWNYTAGDLDLVAGADNGTSTYVNFTPASGTNVYYMNPGTFFLPSNRGTAAMAQIRGERYPFKFETGMQLWLRTTSNTPVTASAAAPLIINFWT